MYAVSRYERETKSELFRVYVTDALKLIAENTAKFAGGSSLKSRYYDMAKPKSGTAKEDRSGDEIADDIISRLARR